MNDAKKAIQEFDQSNVFGSRLLKVEFWESPEEREEKREQKQWRQMKQFLAPPKSFDDGNMAQGQQRGGYNKGRGGKPNTMPRQGQFNNQGPRQQPVMSGNNFPAMGGHPGQPMVQQPQPLTPQQKQQIGDQIYPHIHARYPEHSAKIVGVLLDTPQVDQMRLIQDQTYLMGVAEQVNVNFQRQMQAAQNTTTQQ